MAKRVPIKPGCLCLVVGNVTPLPGVVDAGHIVTAVCFVGNVVGMGRNGTTHVRDAWKVTNQRIEAYRQGTAKYVAIAERHLQPISDPAQEFTILLEQAEELVKEVTGIPSK